MDGEVANGLQYQEVYYMSGERSNIFNYIVFDAWLSTGAATSLSCFPVQVLSLAHYTFH